MSAFDDKAAQLLALTNEMITLARGAVPATATPTPAPAPVVAAPVNYTLVVIPEAPTQFAVAAGANPTKFVGSKMPWTESTVTGFRLGVDKVDFSALYVDFPGGDPVSQKYAYFAINGPDLVLRVDKDGPGSATPWPTSVLTLKGIAGQFNLQDLTSGRVFGTDGPPAPPATVDYSKLKLTFEDNFATLDWNKWSSLYIFADPKSNGSTLPSNGEQQWYINKDYAPTAAVKPWSVDATNGLTLTADKAPDALKQYLGCMNNQPGQPGPGSYNYTSGVLINNKVMAQTYGYFEVRAKLPAGKGLWPAFWLLPNSGAWPPEIDVFEVLGHEPNKIYTTQHWVDAQGQIQHTPVGVTEADTTQWHTYGMSWTATEQIFFLDGVEKCRRPTPPGHNVPMYMILNLAVGGYWPGNPDATTVFPAKMNVKYIRAYQFI